MSFKNADRGELAEWGRSHQAMAVQAVREKGNQRARLIVNMLDAGFAAQDVSQALNISLPAAYTAISRSKKKYPMRRYPNGRLVIDWNNPKNINLEPMEFED